MTCPNCSAEIRNGSKFCEFCGSRLSLEMQRKQEQLNKAGCPKCGSTNVKFDREKQGEIKVKYANAVIRATVGMCKDCGYTWKVSRGKEKAAQNPESVLPTGENEVVNNATAPRKTWLWVLGWIFIFPVPLTLMIRKKEMPAWKKYGIIVAAWIAYFAVMGASGV